MSDPVDEHLDKAFASLDDVPVRELHATAEVLERRRDGLGKFSSVFRDVANAREGGWGANLAQFHLGENVRRADEKLAEQIADAQARSGGMCATRWPSGIRNSPPPFRNRSGLRLPPEQPSDDGA